MTTTTSRLLTLLSLLQSRRDWPGAVLAERLGLKIGDNLQLGAARLRVAALISGEPDLLGTNFMRGVKRLPFRFTPEK